MTFSFTNYAGIAPQTSPLHDIVSDLLGGYKGAVHAKYLPQMQQADIFNKQIGPMAQLATNPMFMQNPQFQQALGNLVSKAFNQFGHGFEKVNPGEMPTYADQIRNETQESDQAAEDLSHAGKAKTSLSSAGGWLENNFGELGKFITHALPQIFNPELAQKQNNFIDSLARLKQTAVQSGLINQNDAEIIFKQRPDENQVQTMNRVKKRLPSLFNDKNNQNYGNNKEKINYDRLNKNSEILLIGPDGSQGFVSADKANELLADPNSGFREAK